MRCKDTIIFRNMQKKCAFFLHDTQLLGLARAKKMYPAANKYPSFGKCTIPEDGYFPALRFPISTAINPHY